MNDSVYKLSLDIHEHASQAVLKAKKTDTGRKLHITLRAGGTPYTIANDCEAVFKATKPDRTYLFNNCTIENNEIIYEFTERTCTSVGRCKCEIALYGPDGKIITSPRFSLLVDGTIYPDEIVESTDEFSELTKLITGTLEATNAATQAAQKADQAANDANEAINKYGDHPIKFIDNTNGEVKTVLHELPEGAYMLTGFFPYTREHDEEGIYFSNDLVSVEKYEAEDSVVVQFLVGRYLHSANISSNHVDYEKIPLRNLENKENRVSTIDGNSDDEHYPTAKAVYDALLKADSENNSPVKYINNQDADNRPSIRNLETGTYIIQGYFLWYDGGPIVNFNSEQHITIIRRDTDSEMQMFYPSGNKVVYASITDDGLYRKDIELNKTESTDNRVTAIDSTADDEHYPTAKAVKDYLGSNGGSGGHCWQGKKVVFLGDSIAQGYTDQGNVATPYPQVVADNLGMTLTNYGIGGSTVAQQESYGGAFATQAEFESAEKDTGKIYQVITGQGKKTFEYDSDTSTWVNSSVNVRTPLSARWSFMRDDADLIVVQSGTNDFQYDWTPIGTMADRTPYTFYGALHTLFTGLIEKYKGKTIVFLTSLKRAQTPYTTPESQNSYGKTLSDYRDMMLEVCDYYGVPVIDVFSVSGLNPYLESQVDLFDNAKTHPLQWGHNHLGDIVSTRLLCVQRFSSAEYEPPVEPDEPDEPMAVTWNENKALQSGNTALKDMNYRTTCDYVEIPESGLTITLTDDDLEMCVYTYTVNKTQSSAMNSYLTARTHSVPYHTTTSRYVRVMIRSKSQPNAKLITSAMATAGVQFTAS